MPPRVLSTEEAKTAITQLQNIITGGFTDQIDALDSQGRILSDPNIWDGNLASQFRNDTWPETKAALDKARTELEELHQQLGKISQDIFSAGGNG
ncbi:pyrophosphorylase [Glutamicibacter sp. JC586]|uniref:pyrophosphorylase n=1 Tax=Glutamicibacter sp. JC586 TaxID=2590552 RepID=UPI00135853A3|nr:pyrophosphorylase [Glutamicibacter sp. JC586]